MVEIRNRFYVVRKLQIVFDARCGNRLSKKMINATVNDFILVIVRAGLSSKPLKGDLDCICSAARTCYDKWSSNLNYRDLFT